jgi:hypothetical protein
VGTHSSGVPEVDLWDAEDGGDATGYGADGRIAAVPRKVDTNDGDHP